MTPDALDDLKRRLLEAEETIRAIREGEVDALVIGLHDQPEIFSIGGDSEAFRSFMEVMDTGAAAVDDRGCIIYANTTFASAFDKEAQALQGVPIADMLPLPDYDIARLLTPDPQGSDGIEITLKAPSGKRDLLLSGRPLRLGTVNGQAITLADVTERVRAERADQTERMAQAILASANEAVLVCDMQGFVTHANGAAFDLCDRDPVGLRFTDIVPLVSAPDAGLDGNADILNRAMSGRPVRGLEVVAPTARGSQDFSLSAAPLLMAGSDIGGCVVTLVDMSLRKEAERQQLLLMHELDHRVKNTLAMVLAISRRTLQTAPNLKGFGDVFTERVRALAATHNLLARNAWQGLSVRDITVAELSPFADLGGDRVDLGMLDQLITPDAAIALGLILHELATNAVKHGALSGDQGSVRVHPVHADDGTGFVIEWRERGGRRVGQDRRKGYGETVITQGMLFAHGGKTKLSYDPEGVICTIHIPAGHLVEAGTRLVPVGGIVS